MIFRHSRRFIEHALVTLSVTACAASAAPAAPRAPDPTAVAPPASADGGEHPARQGAESRALVPVPPVRAPRALDRAGLVREVLAKNPEVAVARATLEAARAEPVQRASLADPMLSWSFAPLSIGSSRAHFGQTLEIAQRIPWPGKLASRGDVARHEARAARHDLEATRLDLAFEASRLYDDWFVAWRALEVNAAQRALVEHAFAAARGHYTVERGSLLAMLDPELGAIELEREAVAVRAQRDTVRARINALLHRPPDARLDPPPAELPRPSGSSPSSVALRREALDRRPELSSARARVAAAASEQRVTERDDFPDVTVMGAYSSMWPMVEHQFMLGFSTELPLARASRAGAKRGAAARSVEASAEQARLAVAIQREVEEARIAVVEAAEQLDLVERRLLPAERDRLAVAKSALVTDATDLTTLLTLERAVLAAELARDAALAEIYRRRAHLDRAVGRVTALENGRPR